VTGVDGGGGGVGGLHDLLVSNGINLTSGVQEGSPSIDKGHGVNPRVTNSNLKSKEKGQ
jgi:hypothetical protein